MLQAVQNNGSVYLHAFFAPSGLAIDPSDPFYKEDTVFSKTFSACPSAHYIPTFMPSLTSVFRKCALVNADQCMHMGLSMHVDH